MDAYPTRRCSLSYTYTMVVGIYGSKPTEPEGEAPRARWVYVAINPYINLSYNHGITITYTMVVGIYGSKPTEPEGEAPRARWVYVAINP